MNDSAWHDRLFTLTPYLAAMAVVVTMLAYASHALAPQSSADLSRAETLTLAVFETESCIYCQRFRQDIAPGFGQTDYARRAALRTLHISEQGSAGFALKSRITTVPTFVLIDREGHEVDRIRGYPGRDAFYPALDRLLAKAPRV